MAYIINKTDGTQFTVINDGEKLDPTNITGVCSLFLIGKNYPTYGEFQNENFVRLLENHASGLAPTFPLRGQLWYDTTQRKLKLYNGNLFISVGATVSSLPPVEPSTGDLWYAQDSEQIYTYNGNDWVLIGPAFSAQDGRSGTFVEKLWDNTLTPSQHLVLTTFIGNTRVTIQSNDVEFTPNVVVPGFTKIQKGVNYSFGSNIEFALNRDATDSIAFTSTKSNVGIKIVANISGNTTSVLSIDGVSGLVSVAANPVGNLNVTTKQYVDTLVGAVYAEGDQDFISLEDKIKSNVAVINANLALLTTNAATQQTQISTLTANAASQAVSINNLLANAVTQHFSIGHLQTDAVNQTISINNLDTRLTAANLVNNSNAAVQAVQINNLLSNAAVQATTLNGLWANAAVQATQIDLLVANSATQAVSINSLNLNKADLASPNLSGNPTAPTQSTPDNSTRLATTAFVKAAIPAALDAKWKGSDQYVSTSLPLNNQGNNGDIWFVI